MDSVYDALSRNWVSKKIHIKRYFDNLRSYVHPPPPYSATKRKVRHERMYIQQIMREELDVNQLKQLKDYCRLSKLDVPGEPQEIDVAVVKSKRTLYESADYPQQIKLETHHQLIYSDLDVAYLKYSNSIWFDYIPERFVKDLSTTASTSKASTSKASTSKASTSKASTSKASTSTSSTSKASTSKASTSTSSISKASTSTASTSTASTSTASTSTASTSTASTSKASTSTASTSTASTSKASTSTASTSKASTSTASTSKASPSTASPSTASPSKASPSTASTSTASTSRASTPAASTSRASTPTASTSKASTPAASTPAASTPAASTSTASTSTDSTSTDSTSIDSTSTPSTPSTSAASTPSTSAASTPSTSEASTPSTSTASTPSTSAASTPSTSTASTPSTSKDSTASTLKASTPSTLKASTPSFSTTSTSTASTSTVSTSTASTSTASTSTASTSTASTSTSEPNVYKNPLAPIKEHKDIVLVIRIYEPYKYVSRIRSSKPIHCSHEMLLLGSQTLDKLRDGILCSADYATGGDISQDPAVKPGPIAKDIYKSAFIFIENVFYNDTRDPKNHDNSQVIREWAKSRKLADFETASMESVTFQELTVRFGFPYVYQHQGNCEHLIIFSDARLISDRDTKCADHYPVYASIGKKYTRNCMICAILVARWVTIGNDKVPIDPCFFCDGCFQSCNYKDGKKIGNFKAYSYYEGHILT